MVDKKTYYVGILIVAILLVSGSIVYVTFDNDLRIRIDEDKSTFYTKNDANRWVVAGREYNRMFDGSSIMNRRKSGITIETTVDSVANTTTIIRTTPYIRGPVIKDVYFFDGKVDSEELFPVYHKAKIYNGSGYYYRYSVDELTDTGPKHKLTGETELNFGLNMKVTLHPNYRWAWIGWPYGSDSLSAQYDIKSDYEVFDVKLFDPPAPVAGWQYYRQINITNPVAETFTNFVYPLNLSTTTEISGGKMNTSCFDVRFFDSDDSTALNYDLENNTCNTAQTVFHVNLPQFNGSEVKPIYMYYGNLSATNGEDVTNTYANTGIVDYWHYEQTSGTQLGPVVGTYNGTMINGPTWNDSSVCKFGYCAQYNAGSSQYTTFGQYTGVDGNNNWTFLGWSYHIDQTTHNPLIANRADADSNNGFETYPSYNGFSDKPYCAAGDGGGDFQITQDAGLTHPTGVWTHFAWVIRADDTNTVYLNATLSDDGTGTNFDTLGATTQAFYHGRSSSGGTSYMDGLIDDVQVRDYNMSANELTAVYSRTYLVGAETEISGDTCTYSSGDWDVACSDDCSITSAVDGAGNDFALTGTGTFSTTADIIFDNYKIEGTDGSNRCIVNCNGGCFIK